MTRKERSLSSTLVRELELEDVAEYQAMFRMDKSTFDYVLDLVTPYTKKQDTLIRECVSPRERLQVTLRFLATGTCCCCFNFNRPFISG